MQAVVEAQHLPEAAIVESLQLCPLCLREGPHHLSVQQQRFPYSPQVYGGLGFRVLCKGKGSPRPSPRPLLFKCQVIFLSLSLLTSQPH